MTLQRYRRAAGSLRAVVTESIRSKDSVTFLVAMAHDGVLPITMPVPAPHAVTGLLFEWWCM